MRLMMTGLKRSARIRRVMADLIAGEQPYATLRGRLLRTMEWKLAMELFLQALTRKRRTPARRYQVLGASA